MCCSASTFFPFFVSCRTKLARLLHIKLNLADESIDVFEFLFRSEITDKTHFQILAVNVAVEIEQMNFENSLGLAATHGWTITEINHAGIERSIERSFGKVNPVGWELFAVSAKIRGWKSDFLPEIITAHDCPENRVLAAEHC